MNTEIRLATISDAHEINRLSLQLGYQLTREQTRMAIQQIEHHEEHFVAVAVSGERIIGWIHAFKAYRVESLPFVEIAGLVVDESYRNKGIGRLLITSVADWCRLQNTAELRVRCHVKRKDAHLFYKQLGFNEAKEQKVFVHTIH